MIRRKKGKKNEKKTNKASKKETERKGKKTKKNKRNLQQLYTDSPSLHVMPHNQAFVHILMLLNDLKKIKNNLVTL